MKKYTKTHTDIKAAEAHVTKIKAKGGKVKSTEKDGKIKLEYSFPKKD